MTTETQIHRPSALSLTPVWAWLKRFYTRRQDRALVRSLTALDDNMLKDIGVTGNDVIWASSLPLSQNAATELRLVSLHHRRKL